MTEQEIIEKYMALLKEKRGKQGALLYLLRKINNLTLDQLSWDVKVARTHLNQVENGKYPFSIEMIFKLSKIFGVSMDLFLENK